MQNSFVLNFRDSHRNQLDIQCFLILICFVFTWLIMYLTTENELYKALFIQNSLISTWTIGYALRVFLPATLKMNLIMVVFRSTVTLLNGAALLMTLYFEDFAVCFLLFLSIYLSKSIFLAGPKLAPNTCSLIEWLLMSMGCSSLFLSTNLHWWSHFEDIIHRPTVVIDYVVVCECLLLFGLIVSMLQVVPWSIPIQSGIQFYISVFAVFFGIFFPQTYFFLNENPFIWLFNCIIKESHRTYLLISWFIVSLFSIFVIYLHLTFFSSKHGKEQQTIIRKYFHFLAIIVYTSGIFIDRQLLIMCSVAFVVLLLLLECIKVKKVPPLGEIIGDAWNIYENEKDVGPLMVSHLFLIIGLSYPVWLADNNRRLAQMSGIISVGIGDSVASIVGSKIGRHRWPGRKRTLEGSLAGLIAQFSFIVLLWSLGVVPYSQVNLWFVSAGLLLITQVEAWSDDIDNLTLPIILFPFLYACETF